MNIVDLRSDTVTQPTPEMRAVMAAADVGDDVYGEDPTINLLQEMASARLGKQSGLFVPSGTMGNLIAVLAHCERGDEAIMGTLGHTFLFEAGGISALGGVFPHTIPNQADGTLKLEDIQAAIRPEDVHQPISKLLILENTQNRCGGVILTPGYTRQAGELAHKRGLALHIDGARIFNAAVGLGVPVTELTDPAESVTFCLSKGLCAPVGSVLVGSKEFIQKAHRLRKQLGGGMRQAGILAAAGIYALEHMVERLADDHRRAKMLARGLVNLPGIQVEIMDPPSNMVFLRLSDDPQHFTPALAEKILAFGVKVGISSPKRFRLVTHNWIDDASVAQTIHAFQQVMKEVA
jgi:threonine aldolase